MRPWWSGLVGNPLLIGNVLIAVQQSVTCSGSTRRPARWSKRRRSAKSLRRDRFRLGNLLVVLTADGSVQHIESLVPEFVASVKPEPVKAQPVATEKPAEEKPSKDEKRPPRTSRKTNEKKDNEKTEKPETSPKKETPASDDKADSAKTE